MYVSQRSESTTKHAVRIKRCAVKSIIRECVTSIELIRGQLKWRTINCIWTRTGHVRKCMDASVTGKIVVTKDTEKNLVRELLKSNNRLRRHTVLKIENISLNHYISINMCGVFVAVG